VCMYIYMHVSIHACMYICMYSCKYTYVYVWVCMYVCVVIYVCMYGWMHVFLCTCMYVWGSIRHDVAWWRISKGMPLVEVGETTALAFHVPPCPTDVTDYCVSSLLYHVQSNCLLPHLSPTPSRARWIYYLCKIHFNH